MPAAPDTKLMPPGTPHWAVTLPETTAVIGDGQAISIWRSRQVSLSSARPTLYRLVPLTRVTRRMTMRQRCAWAESDPLRRAYHDEEWGTPERDSRALWEKLMLDGFQAGLSWITILRKRDACRHA